MSDIRSFDHKMRPSTRQRVLLLAALCSFLISQVQAKLKVQGNELLLDRLSSRGKDFEYLNYSLAHFGVVPYGATILGYAHFDPQNEDGCKRGSLEKFNADDLQPIVIVRRDGCDFIDKTKNAQMAGAAMLIIVDSKQENVGNLNAIADHDGSKSKIPTVLIEKEIGEEIIRVLTDKNQEIRESVILQFTIELAKTDEVQVRYIMGVDNDISYRFLASFKDIYAELDNQKLNWNYTFFFDDCVQCNSDLIKTSCLNAEGKYCLFTSKIGVEQMKVVLFHKCALENSQFKTDYMAFAEVYRETCLSSTLSSSKLLECSKSTAQAFIHSGFDKIEKCVEKNSLSSQVPILEDDAAFFEKSKIKEYPQVIVNNRTIDGTFGVNNVFQAICMGYNKPPNACSFINGKYTYSKGLQDKIVRTRQSQHNFFFFNLVIAVIIFGAAGFLFYYIFKRVYRRMIVTNIDTMIQESISKYKRVNQSGEVEV